MTRPTDAEIKAVVESSAYPIISALMDDAMQAYQIACCLHREDTRYFQGKYAAITELKTVFQRASEDKHEIPSIQSRIGGY